MIFVKNIYQNIIVNVIPFELTYTDRDILEIIINNTSIYNVHLESMNYKQFQEARQIQLTTLINLVKTKRSICCGDFNIKHSINNIPELGTEHTYFSSRFNNGNYSERYDRVIFNDQLQCDLVGYLGNDKYEFGYCSDHNGIIFTLQT